jgi:RNase P protein component
LTTALPKSAPRVNYLNNRDILKQIHLSKNTYCAFRDPVLDHQHDIILLSVAKINQRTTAEARRNRAARIARETGEDVNDKKIANTDLVFRVMTWEHIPMAAKKPTKATTKKRRLEDIFELEDPADTEDDPVVEIAVDPTHMRVNFPPFFHYRINEHRVPYIVGKSHWQGDLDTGAFSKTHGDMTRRLAEMFIKLCERYATRSNWRGYTYNEEMRGQALLQLSQIGLQFDESKSQNPFAYYTAAITNSFTRILNIEKKNQNIRDDILEMNGLNPSWTRQYRDADKKITPTLSALDD